MAIHDLSASAATRVPRGFSGWRWERREYRFRNGDVAMLLLADSEVGKEDILNFYGPMVSRLTRSRFCPFSRPAILAYRSFTH